MRAYVKLFQELDRCEFIVDYEYKGNIDDYEYNGITYSQSSAFYYDYLNNLYNDFLVEWSSLGEEDRTVAHGMMNLMEKSHMIGLVSLVQNSKTHIFRITDMIG